VEKPRIPTEKHRREHILQINALQQELHGKSIVKGFVGCVLTIGGGRPFAGFLVIHSDSTQN
jgi:hypothetical protein